MEKLISFMLILLCFESCVHSNELNDFIEFKSEIKADTIKSISTNRGILTLNKEHYLHGNSILIYKDTFPKWIKDHGKPDFSFDEYAFKPFITDIDAPYVLYKFKNEKYFFVIKNNDTLKFRLDNF
ncbi:MAG: hypothetical protein H7Z76_13310 [Methylotenera sp.]|nr:hypothetical protein [Flavobacterium sp.]